MKLAATLLSSVSGIPGGLFAPSLSVGAGLAAALSWLLPSLDVRALGLLAMVGYFAGVVQAPLTAFVIVLEMTADNGMVVPLMATALLATGASWLVCPHPLYHKLSRNYAQQIRVRVGEHSLNSIHRPKDPSAYQAL